MCSPPHPPPIFHDIGITYGRGQEWRGRGQPGEEYGELWGKDGK